MLFLLCSILKTLNIETQRKHCFQTEYNRVKGVLVSEKTELSNVTTVC